MGCGTGHRFSQPTATTVHACAALTHPSMLTCWLCAAVCATRMDVSLRVSPDALVGRQLRVYWELDDAWFAGSVEAWDPRTARHKVRPSLALNVPGLLMLLLHTSSAACVSCRRDWPCCHPVHCTANHPSSQELGTPAGLMFAVVHANNSCVITVRDGCHCTEEDMQPYARQHTGSYSCVWLCYGCRLSMMMAALSSCGWVCSGCAC